MQKLPIFHAAGYDAGFAPGHRFPMGKYSRLAALLAEDPGFQSLVAPAPAPAAWLELAHARSYVDQVIACSVPALIEREIGFPVDEAVSLRARLATGGTVAAARAALETGIAGNAAGGSHHARHAHGAGFCTFNDAAVTARLLTASGEVQKVMIFDLDVHQGDGTAEICAGDPAVFTVSMHAQKNYPVRKVASCIDMALPDHTGDDAYLSALGDLLSRSIAAFAPDLVIYNAGVDPHVDDRLGRLSLTDEGLRMRDRMVLSFFRSRSIPVAFVIGGGYSVDIEALARRHLITFEEARRFA